MSTFAATWHSSNLMVCGISELDMQISSAVANQCRIESIPVVGRQDENLAYSETD